MNSVKLLTTLAACLALSQLSKAQSPYLFHVTFRGTAYQTNGDQVVATPITETNLLLAAAQAGGSSDISGLALIYHIAGDPDHGDTIEVDSTSNYQTLNTMFGLYFGDDVTLGRTALTNSSASEIRRLDYVYTFDYTELTYPNSHSMGASFTTKRFLTDTNGNVNTTINGQIEWIVNPNGNEGTKVCVGSFTTTTPVPP